VKPLLRFASLILLAALGIHAGAPLAQSYPSRPIRIVVPYPAGGEIDLVARLFGPKMANALNQPVLVENRPGAGGNIGSDAVAKAAPDGYTLLMTPSNLAIAPSIYRKLPFDGLKDFTAVSQLCSTYLILVTNSRLPAMSVRELIALAKSRPASLNYGHAGAGSTLQLTMELLKTLAGIDIQAIPYKGTSPISTALVTGEVDAAFMSLATVVPHIKAGKLRALAVTSPVRSPVLPEVPTVVEAGVQDFVGLPGWFGLFAPAGTPRDIVELIQQEAVKALKISDLRDRIFGMGWEIVGSTPTEFEETYKADIAKFARIVKEARVPLQD
jgi:tripartite-type tricarboxylate transporter receptor subunit TctC